MGWSCSSDADATMEKWTKACIASTGSQNTWREESGEQFFVDISNREHHDGAITGSVYKMLPGNMAQKVGSVRIDGTGRVVRAPAFLKRAALV